MITSRMLEEGDQVLLELSLAKDAYHKETPAEFFYAPGSVCNVYEDETGPIMFVRGTKALRVDIQFTDNNDFERNKKALSEAFGPFAAKAKAAGFTELVFFSESPLLMFFCKREFGFEEVSGEFRKFL